LTAAADQAYARPAKADEPSGSPALAFLLGKPAGAAPQAAYWLLTKRVLNQKPEGQMGLLDKLLGRGKKAAGDLMGDASMRHEGAAQERQGAAEDRAAQHEEMAQEQRNQAAEAHAERENT
jgi:uncharacterized protein YjbJ (UPF0337 family)